MNRMYKFAAVFAAVALLLTACGPAATPAPTAALAATSAPTAAPTAKPFKVAIVLPGVITDNGWNASAYEGLQLVKAQLGAEIAYSEAVPQTDYETAFRDYASQGYDLVIGHGFEFGDPVMKIAPDFPNTKFVVVNNVVTASNVASVEFNNEEAGFLAGVVAGLMTKTNKVGGVGGFDIASIVRGINGFEQGVKYVNPKAEVFVTYTQSWDDIAKGKEAGLALIDRGADVVWEFADAAGLGVIEAAKEKGVYAIASVRDKSSAAPDTILVSTLEEVPPLILDVAKTVKEGTFEGQMYRFGVEKGPIRYAGWNAVVPADVKAKAEQVLADIAAGKIKIERKDTR
ncbi:MAG: BMP family protein [Chloroflexi bacterium]|nr:BMP family protein [Chloroflexota bacterium]